MQDKTQEDYVFPSARMVKLERMEFVNALAEINLWMDSAQIVQNILNI